MTGWWSALLAFGGVALARLREEFDDKALVELARKQDAEGKDAFGVLVERHQEWLVSFLAHMISSRTDAEELAQNVLVRAFFALPRFRGEASFRTWLRTIATREAFSFYRKRGETPTPVEDLDSFSSTEAPAQRQVAEREAIKHCLNRVPYPYREILVLRYIEELSLEEIGEALDLGKSATKMRLKRAREFFQEAYSDLDAPHMSGHLES